MRELLPAVAGLAGHAVHNFRFGKTHAHKHTQTMTKENEKGLVGDDVHSGIHRASIHYHTGHGPQATAFGSYIKYAQQNTFLLTSTSGTALTTDLFSIGSLAQWETSTGSSYGAYTNYQPFLALNPGAKITGSTVYTPALTPANDRMVLHSVQTIMDMTNVTTLPLYGKIRVYIAKRDTNLTPLAVYSYISTSSQMGIAGVTQVASTVTAAQFGSQSLTGSASTAGGGATGAVSFNFLPGTEAAAFKDFTKLYKCLHTHVFELAAGGAERVILEGKLNIKHIQSVDDALGSTFPKNTIFIQTEILGAVSKLASITAGAAPVAHGAGQLAVVVQNMFRLRASTAATNRSEIATAAAWEALAPTVRQVYSTDTAGNEILG